MKTKTVRILALAVVIVLSLSIGSFAAGLVRESVEYKDSPEYKDPGFEIIITPYTDNDDVKDEKLKDDMDNLRQAYEELDNADSITEILDEGDLRESIGLEEKGEYDVDRLKVDNLFDVYTDKEGEWEFTFEVDHDKDDVIAIAFKDIDGNWSVLDYKDNGDGTVTVILDGNGTIAVLVDAQGKKDPGYSADTGDNSNTVLWIVILVAAVAGVAVVLVSFKASKKKKNEQ